MLEKHTNIIIYRNLYGVVFVVVVFVAVFNLIITKKINNVVPRDQQRDQAEKHKWVDLYVKKTFKKTNNLIK